MIKAFRVVVKQSMKDDEGRHRDASFVEYVTTYDGASRIVKRFNESDDNRSVEMIYIETIRIRETN